MTQNYTSRFTGGAVARGAARIGMLAGRPSPPRCTALLPAGPRRYGYVPVPYRPCRAGRQAGGLGRLAGLGPLGRERGAPDSKKGALSGMTHFRPPGKAKSAIHLLLCSV